MPSGVNTWKVYLYTRIYFGVKIRVSSAVHDVTKQTMVEGGAMHFSKEQTAKIEILARYNLETTQQGIKVHSSASEEHVEAIRRLFEKGLVTKIDGGYLTDLGKKAAEHAQALILILTTHHQSTAS